jgi:hypothetical protein
LSNAWITQLGFSLCKMHEESYRFDWCSVSFILCHQNQMRPRDICEVLLTDLIESSAIQLLRKERISSRIVGVRLSYRLLLLFVQAECAWRMGTAASSCRAGEYGGPEDRNRTSWLASSARRRWKKCCSSGGGLVKGGSQVAYWNHVTWSFNGSPDRARWVVSKTIASTACRAMESETTAPSGQRRR